MLRTISLGDDCRQETAAANHTYNGGRRVFGITGSNPEHDVAACLSIAPESWVPVPLRPFKELFAEQGWGACDQEGRGFVLLPGRAIFCPFASPKGNYIGIVRPHFGVAAMMDVRQCEGGVIVVSTSINAVLLREGMIVAEEVMFERARQESDEALDEARRVAKQGYRTGQVAALTGVLLTLGVEQPSCATCDKEEAGACGGEHACTDPAAIHMEVVARIRDADDELVRERAAADRLRQDLRAANTEFARLREQTTPRRAKGTVRDVLVWSPTGRKWMDSTPYAAPGQWWLPQPPPPPDEAWQEAEAEARKARAEVSQLADAMEAGDNPPARGRTGPGPGSQE